MDEPSSPAQAPARPADDDLVPVDVQLAWQEQYCLGAGAPTAALVLAALRQDLASGGTCSRLIPEQTRFGDLIGLRIMATLHLLAIERLAPGVALHAPTLGGTAPDACANPARERIRFRQAVIDAIEQHPERFRACLDQVPQTNEVGRAIPLRIALAHIHQANLHQAQPGPTQPGPTHPGGLPIRLTEIGASAGLNLRADGLPGRPDLEPGPMPRIIERLGCDLNPIDPTTTQGRARLTSYIWLDDLDRYERLRHALQVAATMPATVRQQDALSFARSLEPSPGAVTVLWHSAMWIYLPATTRASIEDEILRMGGLAGPEQPFWHVSWEWSEQNPGAVETFALTARSWSGRSTDGAPVMLATGSSHGRSVRLATGSTADDGAASTPTGSRPT